MSAGFRAARINGGLCRLPSITNKGKASIIDSTTVRQTSAVTSQTEEIALASARPFEEIPGPRAIPILGSVWKFLPFIDKDALDRSHRTFAKLYKEYGSIVRFVGPVRQPDIVVVHDPEDAEKVYRNEGAHPRRPGFDAVAEYRRRKTDVYGDTLGLLVEQGEKWQKFRSKVQQPMMRPQMANAYVKSIANVSQDFVERIRILRDSKHEMPDDFQNELYKWALESIGIIALDTRLGCLEPSLAAESEPQKLIDAIKVIFHASHKLQVGLQLWRYFKTKDWIEMEDAQIIFNKTAMKYIEQAMDRIKSRDEMEEKDPTLLERILARDPNPKTALVMALDMLFAGVDTTSMAVAYLLYNLSIHPEKQEKLYKEIRSVLPIKNEDVTVDKIENLSYLRCCIKESMRLLPIVNGNARFLQKDIVLSGFRVKAGSLIFINDYQMCHRADLYPDPESFIPERWIGKSDEARAFPQPPRFAALPFGHGPRMCIGRRFAELEIKILSTKILQQFQIEWNHGELDMLSRLINVPDKPLKFKFIERSDAFKT